jgi:hypothetical protein
MSMTAEASNIHTKLYDSPAIAQIAGVEVQVLLGWRRRHDFLGGMVEGKKGRGGYLHSFIEALVVVAVAAMIRRGLEVSDAVRAEDDLAAVFEMMTETETGDPRGAPTIFGYHPQGRDGKTKFSIYLLRPEMTLAETMEKSGALYLLDLAPIYATVKKKLRISHLVKLNRASE